jgi:hypothetical protein
MGSLVAPPAPLGRLGGVAGSVLTVVPLFPVVQVQPAGQSASAAQTMGFAWQYPG